MYAGKSLSQVLEIKRGQEAIVKSEAEKALQAKIDLIRFIETAAKDSVPPVDTDIKGIREQRQSEIRKLHRNIEKEIDNE